VLQNNEIRVVKEAPGTYTSGFQNELSLKIEEVLRRAREIHRQHGGVFGYDFEDWAAAWRELPQSNGSDSRFAVENGAELLSQLEEVCE
jgi:sugar/nucleoside kinase (ribokinase family)